MKRHLKLGLIAMVAITLFAVSCKKDKQEDAEIKSSEDQALSEAMFDQVFKQVDEAAQTTGLKKGAYPIISIDSAGTNKTMRVDYGSENYLCKDGNLRRGIILVTWSGAYRDINTIIRVGFENFYQNNNQVEGEKTITNKGENALGHMVFTIVVNGKITRPDGSHCSWNSNRVRTWISGKSTLIAEDDVYEITGTTNGVSRAGISYNAIIIKPLKVMLNCQWRMVSGQVELTPEAKPIRLLDFGNGECDNSITITVNGKTRTISKTR